MFEPTLTMLLSEFDFIKDRIRILDEEKYALQKDIQLVYGFEYTKIQSDANRMRERADRARIKMLIAEGKF